MYFQKHCITKNGTLSCIIWALFENNMNVSTSAKELYLHRNTLINWINRYKDLFGIDPINDSAGREFTQQLFYFYTHTLSSDSY